MTGQTELAITFLDKVRREWYLFKLVNILAGLPGKQAQQTVDSLRGELTTAAYEVGMKEAINQIGPARVLGQEYLDAHGKPVPRVYAGLIAFAILLYGWLFAVISHLEGMINTAQGFISATAATGESAGSALAAEPITLTSRWLLNDFYVTVSGSEVEAFGIKGDTLSLVVTLAVFIVIPLIFARVWRAWQR